MSDGILDMRGQLCPLPIIELARALRHAAQITLLADDVAAEADVPAWCRMRRATLVSVTDVIDGGKAYVVRAAETSASA